MKISYNEATAKDCSNLEKDLILCEKAGFDFIEIRIDMLSDYLKSHDVSELVSFFKRSHLKPHAFNALYIYPELFGENDSKDKREALLDRFISTCEVSQKIGSHDFIIVPPIHLDLSAGPFVGEWEKIKKDCVRILRNLSDIANAYDMRLSFEPVGLKRCAVRSVKQADEIIREVDRANVGFVFDSYNLYMYHRNDFSVMESVDPNKIFTVHINNADDVPEEAFGQEKRRLCDKGIIDLKNFLLTLKKVGYNGIVSIETFRLEYWELDAETVITRAYTTTKEIMESCNVLS